MTAAELRYGRRGGGYLPAGHDPTAPIPPCTVCGAPCISPSGHHQACTPAAADDDAAGRLDFGSPG